MHFSFAETILFSSLKLCRDNGFQCTKALTKRKGIDRAGALNDKLLSIAMKESKRETVSSWQMAKELLSAGLFLVHFDDVLLIHLEDLRRLVVVDPAAVKEESKRVDRNSDPLGVGLLELAHLRGHLDAEVDLVRVLSDHLQLDVLRLCSVGHR